jgi:hypothetical protein
MSRRVVLGVYLARTSRAVSSFAITCSVALSLPDIHVSSVPNPSFVSSPAFSLARPLARIGIAASPSSAAQSWAD